MRQSNMKPLTRFSMKKNFTGPFDAAVADALPQRMQQKEHVANFA